MGKLYCKSLFVHHQALLSVSHFLATLVFGVVLFTFLGYAKPKEMVFRWFSRAEIKRWWWWRCMHNHVKVPWESCFGCPPEIIFMPDTTKTIRNPMMQKPQWIKIVNSLRKLLSCADIKCKRKPSKNYLFWLSVPQECKQNKAQNKRCQEMTDW